MGAYVYYPVEELLAILALESHRERCMVIGEDLGTVPPEMRTLLHANGVYSYKVFSLKERLMAVISRLHIILLRPWLH